MIQESELSKLTKDQVEMDKLRGEEKATLEDSKAETEKGLNGLKLPWKF